MENNQQEKLDTKSFFKKQLKNIIYIRPISSNKQIYDYTGQNIIKEEVTKKQ